MAFSKTRGSHEILKKCNTSNTLEKKVAKRIVTSIRVDEDVLKEARAFGLNVSKIAENALKEAIRKLEGSSSGDKENFNCEAGPEGFEPTVFGLESRRLIHTRLRAHF